MPPPPPPPPPPATGPGGPVGGPVGGYTVGDAFSYGWTKLQANVAKVIVGALVLMLVAMLVTLVWFAVVGSMTTVGDDPGTFAPVVPTAAVAIVGSAMQYFVQAGIVRAALAITRGEPVELAQLLSTDNIGQVLLGGLLLGAATGVGALLCYVPGLLVAFFGQFFVHFAIDQELPAMDAIMASVSFVNQNLGSLVGFFVASALAVLVGLLLCGIGVVVAIPVVVIAQAYTYRTLRGEAVAA